MKNRIPGNPGRYSAVVPYEEVEKLQSGQPFSIRLTRDDNPVEEGTPYSKETVLPDSVAEQLCPDNTNPTPADAFASLAKVKTAVGDKEEVFNVPDFNMFVDGGYYNVYNEEITKSGCSVYGMTEYNFSKLAGKTIRIRTYMYDDMALLFYFYGEHVTYANHTANIEVDPKSGIFEFDYAVPDNIGEEDMTFYVSFCENPYFNEPVMFEPKGTVWEEIKNLENSSGSGAGGSGGNADLTNHINNKSNPHKVTAAQVGAVTHKELEDALANIPSGGGTMTDEQFADLFHEALENSLIDTIGQAYLEDRLEEYATGIEVGDALYEAKAYTDEAVGDISAALDELHTYAQGLINGGGA